MGKTLMIKILRKIVLVLLFAGFQSQAGTAEGYFIKKGGDTVRVTFNIQSVFEAVNYSALQEKILYLSNGKTVAIEHDLVEKVYFTFKNQVFTYIPVLAQSTLPNLNNKKVFLKLYSESKVRIFEYYYGVAQFGLHTNCANEASNGNSYIYIIHNASTLYCFHKKFMPNVQRLFVGCPEGIKEVKRQGLDCLDVVNVATIFCNYCKQ